MFNIQYIYSLIVIAILKVEEACLTNRQGFYAKFCKVAQSFAEKTKSRMDFINY